MALSAGNSSTKFEDRMATHSSLVTHSSHMRCDIWSFWGIDLAITHCICTPSVHPAVRSGLVWCI